MRSNSDEIELLPCACRGKRSDVNAVESDDGCKWSVVCSNCGNAGSAEDSIQDAATQWNEISRKQSV